MKNGKFFKQSKKTLKQSRQIKGKGAPLNIAKTINYNSPNNMETFRFKKREFITNVIGQEDFTPLGYAVNPGDSETFPWLSQIAPAFQKYKFHKLKFLYETSSPTIIGGVVILAPEFNVTDPLPESKQDLLEYKYATRSAPWENFHLDLRTSDVMNYKEYYVRNTSASSTDLKLSDPLYIICSVDGISDEINSVGELWVEYDIEFTIPQKINNNSLNSSYFNSISVAGITLGQPCGTTTVGSEGTGSITFNQPESTFTFPSGFAGIVAYQIDQDLPFVPEISDSFFPILTVQLGSNSAFIGSEGYFLTSHDTKCNFYMFALKMQPGGTITFTYPGWTSNGDATMDSNGTYWFWNNTYIPSQLSVPDSFLLSRKAMNEIERIKEHFEKDLHKVMSSLVQKENKGGSSANFSKILELQRLITNIQELSISKTLCDYKL